MAEEKKEIMTAAEAGAIADEVNTTNKENELSSIVAKAEEDIAVAVDELANLGKYDLTYTITLGTLNTAGDVLNGAGTIEGILPILTVKGYVVEYGVVVNARGEESAIELEISWDINNEEQSEPANDGE